MRYLDTLPVRRALVAVAALALVAGSCGDDDGDGDGGGETAGSTTDTVAFCRSAAEISANAGVLDPSFDGDVEPTLEALDEALLSALDAAPDEEVQSAVARVRDVVINVDTGIQAGDDLPTALAGADEVVDEQLVAGAVVTLNDALVSCGHEATVPA